MCFIADRTSIRFPLGSGRVALLLARCTLPEPSLYQRALAQHDSQRARRRRRTPLPGPTAPARRKQQSASRLRAALGVRQQAEHTFVTATTPSDVVPCGRQRYPGEGTTPDAGWYRIQAHCAAAAQRQQGLQAALQLMQPGIGLPGAHPSVGRSLRPLRVGAVGGEKFRRAAAVLRPRLERSH